ncbi:MAG: ankyrin repeat domain-containing protein [Bacteroidota bacterium]
MPAGGNWKEMFHAAENGDLELVRYHLSTGIDPNYQHPEYSTGALLESVRKGHLDIVELLLENGAKPDIVKDFGTETPMSIAVAQNNKAAIFLLNKYLPEELHNHQYGTRKKVVVTGGNRGIGRAIAKQLLEAGHEVVIVARNEEQGNAVVAELKLETKNPDIQLLKGDLSSIETCNRLVEALKSEHSDMDVLINNAGVWMMDRELNEDGLEKTFMVNYLAPYILCKELFSTLKQNQPARIVNVNSGLYVTGKLDIEKTPYGLDFGKIKTYANSKFCNMLFNIDFAKEIEGSGVTLNAVHPGVIKTGLGDSSSFLSRIVKFTKRFWKAPEQGAVAPVWLALSEELEGVHGNYYNEKTLEALKDTVQDEELRAAFRLKTEEILGR